MNAIPHSQDLMPLDQPDDLDVGRVVAFALNGVPYEWWRHMPLSETSRPVLQVVRLLKEAKLLREK